MTDFVPIPESIVREMVEQIPDDIVRGTECNVVLVIGSDEARALIDALPVEMIKPGDPRHPCPICNGTSKAMHFRPCSPVPAY